MKNKTTTPSEWTQPWGGCAERSIEFELGCYMVVLFFKEIISSQE